MLYLMRKCLLRVPASDVYRVFTSVSHWQVPARLRVALNTTAAQVAYACMCGILPGYDKRPSTVFWCPCSAGFVSTAFLFFCL